MRNSSILVRESGPLALFGEKGREFAPALCLVLAAIFRFRYSYPRFRPSGSQKGDALPDSQLTGQELVGVWATSRVVCCRNDLRDLRGYSSSPIGSYVAATVRGNIGSMGEVRPYGWHYLPRW